MLVLLPPSETKRFGGRQQFSYAGLHGAARLDSARQRVRAALTEASRDEATAVRVLKLGVKNRGERQYNLQLATSGAMPAVERYTGVLYDALDVSSLETPERQWIDEHVAIQSALFGLCVANDLIPAYRLSASSRLPTLSTALAKVWAPAHTGALTGASYVLDLRSKDYAALAPRSALGAQSSDFVEVVTRGSDGAIRALNHFNKAAKGALVRSLARSSPDIQSREDFLDWARAQGLELEVGVTPQTLLLTTTYGVPAGSR